MHPAGLLERCSTSARPLPAAASGQPPTQRAKSKQAWFSVQLLGALLLTMQGQLEGDLGLAHLLRLSLLLLLITVFEGHHLQGAPTLPAVHGWLQPGGLEPGCEHHAVNLQCKAAMDMAWLVSQQGPTARGLVSVMLPGRAAVPFLAAPMGATARIQLLGNPPAGL
jgi:hypothetical protein